MASRCWPCSGYLADCAGSPSIGAQLRWCVFPSGMVTRLKLGHTQMSTAMALPPELCSNSQHGLHGA